MSEYTITCLSSHRSPLLEVVSVRSPHGEWLGDKLVNDELSYCADELAAFYAVDSDEWRGAHRQAVLDKRDEYWRGVVK